MFGAGDEARFNSYFACKILIRKLKCEFAFMLKWFSRIVLQSVTFDVFLDLFGAVFCGMCQNVVPLRRKIAFSQSSTEKQTKMTRKVRFTKMQGVGNDYIYVNTLLNKVSDPSEAARLWSSPHTGIGSDGLVLIGAATESGADFSMRIFNADGSEATMCGNASRCVLILKKK